MQFVNVEAQPFQIVILSAIFELNQKALKRSAFRYH